MPCSRKQAGDRRSKDPSSTSARAEALRDPESDVSKALKAFKQQIASLQPKNPSSSCTVSTGVWYDRTRNRFRASIGRDYKSKWFHTQEGAEIHRAEKKAELDEAKRIAKIDKKIEQLQQQIKALEEQK